MCISDYDWGAIESVGGMVVVLLDKSYWNWASIERMHGFVAVSMAMLNQRA